MKILALDTSTLMTSCALVEDGVLLGEFSLNQDMSHSEKLVPMIKTLLDSLDIKLEEIDLYAASVGPGSFTGLRIGIATIKGFAHVFQKPVVGISSLEALAYNLPYNKILLPMIDARRNRVYTGIYSWSQGRLENLMKDTVISIDDLMDKLKDYDNIVINGEASLKYREFFEEGLGSRVSFVEGSDNSARASSIALLAEKYQGSTGDNYYNLKPEYLRPSQAERELKNGK